MPDDLYPIIPPLIEVGLRTINVMFLIQSEKVGSPDPASEVEISLFPGARFRLTGDDAREWVSLLSRFVPGPRAALEKTVVTRRGKPKVRRKGEV